MSAMRVGLAVRWTEGRMVERAGVEWEVVWTGELGWVGGQVVHRSRVVCWTEVLGKVVWTGREVGSWLSIESKQEVHMISTLLWHEWGLPWRRRDEHLPPSPSTHGTSDQLE